MDMKHVLFGFLNTFILFFPENKKRGKRGSAQFAAQQLVEERLQSATATTATTTTTTTCHLKEEEEKLDPENPRRK